MRVVYVKLEKKYVCKSLALPHVDRERLLIDINIITERRVSWSPRSPSAEDGLESYCILGMSLIATSWSREILILSFPFLLLGPLKKILKSQLVYRAAPA